MNDALKRSLARLGKAAELGVPPVFVEHELALAVRRFGVRKVFVRVLKSWWFWKTIRFRSDFQPPEDNSKMDKFLKELQP